MTPTPDPAVTELLVSLVRRVQQDESELGVLSTSEQLAVAIILNRPDWLAEWRYTLAQAIDRIGVKWAICLRAAEREVI
jgi:hypothetical protein